MKIIQLNPDPILGLSKLFKEDKRLEKIDAGIGVFRNEDNKTFTPQAIKKAYQSLDLGLGDYLSPTGVEEYLGDRVFLEQSAKLVFGNIKSFAATGTPGGTGAVALMFDLFKTLEPEASILIGTPTWPNHLQIAKSKNINIITYSHIKNDSYNFEEHLNAVKNSPKNSLVLFHTAQTHNPTGVNPSEKEWKSLAKVMGKRLAFFDSPYLGFDEGLVEDSKAIRFFMQEEVTVFVALSFAKNGGIYKERPGAILAPTKNSKEALMLQRLINSLARVSYSSPPALGERLIAKVLSTPLLFNLWKKELEECSRTLKERRGILAKEIPQFKFVTEQVGLFSVLPLTEKQVEVLRKDYAIYMPSSGRINFGGITKKDMKKFAKAVKEII